jgi:hypothetical protein
MGRENGMQGEHTYIHTYTILTRKPEGESVLQKPMEE